MVTGVAVIGSTYPLPTSSSHSSVGVIVHRSSKQEAGVATAGRQSLG